MAGVSVSRLLTGLGAPPALVWRTVLAVTVFATVPFESAHAQASTLSDDDRARSLFLEGRDHFEHGRYEEAFARFRLAYELSGQPALLFNLGATSDRLRQDRQAVEYYQAYLEAVPGAPNAEDVRSRMAILRRVLAEAERAGTPDGSVSSGERSAGGGEPATVPPPTAIDEPEPSRATTEESRNPVLGNALLGAGLGVAASGIVAIGLGLSARAEVEGAEPGVTWDHLRDVADSVPVRTGVGFALVGIGSAVAATGLAVRMRTATPARESGIASLVFTPSSFAVRGYFR